VLWLIRPGDDHLNIETPCEFLRHTEYEALLVTPDESACIIVNIGRIAARVRDDLQATDTAKVIRKEFQITGPVM
jgi:ethanolamine utilization protein EutP (predicted NTPase)